jgi:hypothetical protein
MSDLYKNPETEPQDQEWENRHTDVADFPTTIAGPGGKQTLIENNEKGILEENVFRAMATYKQAELGSSHDGHAQGIYSSNGGGKYGD